MASKAAATAVKAIYAEPVFVPKGPINAGRFNLIREIVVGFSLGLTAGLVWKSWHWSEKRHVAQYYAELYQKEKSDDNARNAELKEKLKALEEQLLA